MGADYSAAVFVGVCVRPTEKRFSGRQCSHAIPAGPKPPKFCQECGKETFHEYALDIQRRLVEFDKEKDQYTYHGYQVVMNGGYRDWYIGRQLAEIDPRLGEMETIPVHVREASIDTVALTAQLELDGFEILDSGLMLISLVS